MQNEEFTAVYTANNAFQAEIVKAALVEAEIPCYIEGEAQGGLAGLLDIRLLVRASDAERARALIEEHERLLASEGEESDDEGSDTDFGEPED